MKETPVFHKGTEDEFVIHLQNKFINEQNPDYTEKILNGKYKPSIKLLYVVENAIKLNFEWNLLEEQKLIYNKIVYGIAARRSNKTGKYVLIIRGGPGTGKSVIAIQLLAFAARNNYIVVYGSASKAFNTVLQAVTKHFSREFLKDIFSVQKIKDLPVKELFTTPSQIAKLGSTDQNIFDLVIIDEAHRTWDFRRNPRLNNKKLSETSMVSEIVKSATVTIFLLDDYQSVRANEKGSVDYIKSILDKTDVTFEIIDLNTQFRCGGSKSYLDFIDFTLGITLNISLKWKEYGGYEFQIFDSITKLDKTLQRHRKDDNKCRIVAGFCWNWSEIKGNGELIDDVTDPSFDGWKKPWIEKTGPNIQVLDHRYYKWVKDDSYYNQIGSIYSVQGFEFDYIGVIFGEDLVIRNGKWVAQPKKNKDHVFKRQLTSENIDATSRLQHIYRVLLTRGMKGTYVFFIDEETREYFRRLLE